MTGRPLHKSHPDDEKLISDFKSEAEKTGFSVKHVRDMVGRLNSFSDWCRTTGRSGMAGRLDRLDEDVQSYAKHKGLDPDGMGSLKRVLEKLRNPKLYRGGRKGDSYLKAQCAEDEELISAVRTILDVNLRLKTIATYASTLRRFSDWLYGNKKQPMAGRLHDEGLTKDAQEFARAGDRTILTALTRLRASLRKQEGSVPRAMGSQSPHVAPSVRVERGAPSLGVSSSDTEPGFKPSPEDAALITAAAEVAKSNIRVGTPWPFVATRKRLNREVKHLKAFSDWLRRTGRRPIADRLPDASLNKDVIAFHKAQHADKGARGGVSGGIRMLRDYAKELEDFAADLERQLETNEIPPAAGEGTSPRRARQALLKEIFGESPQSETRQPSPQAHVDGSDVDEAISPMTRDDAFGVSMLDGLPPPEFDHDGHSVPTCMGEPEADFGAYVSLGWRGGDAPAPLIAELKKKRTCCRLCSRRRVCLSTVCAIPRSCGRVQDL
ncbi:hypothetical protein GA0061099_103220 [Bradyrhizobium yuanmingense]|uniref:Core-binding (CB) domain-containing protein n=1 Tax=Bradyrhizobium yuanmingense TaxID=108015 RepID=A0A1C3XJH2_9BRAD|nr:hypothetical protein [Bradyrhizobium yuanmingense]TWI17417.1 hypothetical protein IQ15_07447 [Bradyrhizobium yuanmingense]SCB52427.1 hypothetical protein GA0061099_103220 [Bradyrhizobium yuanmingense]